MASLPESAPHTARSRGVSWRRLVLPVLIVGIALAGGLMLVKTAPRAGRRRILRTSTLVEVVPVKIGRRHAVVRAMGTVVPTHQVTVAARVSGQIISASPEFVPGGRFQAGQVMVRLDSSDFVLAVQRARSALQQARSAYRQELGQQDVARREYALLDTALEADDRDLVLRGPQLRAARAAVAAARASLDRALLDLQRTVVRAPLNAAVLERMADVGAQITPATPLVRLVSTDAFWVDTAVPVDDLKWIEFPSDDAQRGSTATVRFRAGWGDSLSRTGRVVRRRVAVEERGRMARVLVQVDDPLALKPGMSAAPRLILHSYVEVEIEGRSIEHVAVVPRRVLRDGDQVWLMAPDRTLEFRSLHVIYRGRDEVYARGLKPGERLITTDLTTPVQGMLLRTASEPPAGNAGHQGATP